MPEIPFLEEEAMAYVLQVEQICAGLDEPDALWVKIAAVMRHLTDCPKGLQEMLTLRCISALCRNFDPDDPG